LSRGCERATFVERDRRAVVAVRENLRRTRLEERAEVIRADVRATLEGLVREGRRYDLIFADPPYRIAGSEVDNVLRRLGALLSPGGRVVVERGGVPREETRLRKGDTRRYGGTVVTILDKSELTMNLAVCPGSFDPVTAGHLDVIRRAAGIFDHVVIAVGANLRKQPRLPAAERARLVEKVTAGIENVSVEVMDGLLVEFARQRGARVIVKGLRAVSDFESEFEQAQLNRTLFPELETVFIMSAAQHSFLSSSAVREIATFGGDLRGLVPDEILEVVREVYSGGGDRTASSE
jgi:pantetheine-phosphate adenylyltransferase